MLNAADALVKRCHASAVSTRGCSPSAAPAFVTAHYLPFFTALKQQGYVEPFVYWASQRAPVPGVVDWLKGNEPRVRAFLEWASKYDWPKP